MKIRWITHFDSAYAPQGAVMIESLLKFGYQDICVLPLDDDVFPFLLKHGIKCGLWRLDDLEKRWPRLVDIRKSRSHRSWTWTLEPAWCAFMLSVVDDGDIVCYTDADMWWVSDPIPAIRSVMEHADVALSPHRFPAGQEHRYRSVGKFNFGVSVMRSCDLTRKVVGEWLDQTLEKCDEHAGGDQIYLDLWIDKLGMRLAELPFGWNVGPWRQVPWTSDFEGREIIRPIGLLSPAFYLESYHFHEFRRGAGRNPITLKGEAWNRTNYELHPSTIESVYLPYEVELSKYV